MVFHWLLLHDTGLISLKGVTHLTATLRDIIENPKKLEFIELDAARLPGVLPDVDLAFVNNIFAVSARLTPDKALLVENNRSPYVNVIISRVDNKDAPRIAQLVAACQSEAVEQVAGDLFKGNVIKGW